MVRKRSGRREPFDRQKVVAGVLAAGKNRPISADDAEELAAAVESALVVRGPEVSSAAVGREVLLRLRSLDEVAYLRFASVYKGFAGPGDFAAELGLLGDPNLSEGAGSAVELVPAGGCCPECEEDEKCRRSRGESGVGEAPDGAENEEPADQEVADEDPSATGGGQCPVGTVGAPLTGQIGDESRFEGLDDAEGDAEQCHGDEEGRDVDESGAADGEAGAGHGRDPVAAEGEFPQATAGSPAEPGSEQVAGGRGRRLDDDEGTDAGHRARPPGLGDVEHREAEAVGADAEEGGRSEQEPEGREGRGAAGPVSSRRRGRY
jgi:hypothetical protein